ISGAFGLDGGGDGAPGCNMVMRADGTLETLDGNDFRLMERGDVFVVETPAGGGYGNSRAG
ncbi:MAG: hydantoinase B/oxoprolinase family protein, partial [Octadecabacter sp.]